MDCAPGTYQDFSGQKDCKKCDVDTYLESSGKSSKADCQQCNDDRSTGSSTGNTNVSACLCKRKEYYKNAQGGCLECPVGADCSMKDGLLLAEMSALPGYWRSTVQSEIFSPCSKGHRVLDAETIAQKRCCPIDQKTNTSICLRLNLSNTTTDAQCLRGYSGSLCLVCAKGYVSLGGECISCPGGSSIFIAMIPVGSMCFCFFLLVLAYLFHSKKKKHNIQRSATARASVVRNVKRPS